MITPKEPKKVEQTSTICDKIRYSVESLEENKKIGLKLLYGSANNINVQISSKRLPAAFYTLLQDTTILVEGNQIKERANVMIFFVDKTEFGKDTYENEEIIQKMKLRAYSWIASLFTSDLLICRSVENNAVRIYDGKDTLVTGIGIQLELEEVTGYCIS